MLIYYLVWFLLLVFTSCEIISFHDKERKLLFKRNLIFFLFCVFAFLVGCKGNVGTDYLSYKSSYYIIGQSGIYNPIYALEPGYWYWAKFISLLGSSFTFFWFLTCSINIGIKFYVFSKLSPYVSVSLAVYFIGLFFERDFDGIRQGISIGICYLGVLYYLQGKIKSFYVMLMLAFSFHYTSIVFLLVPFLSKWKISGKTIFFSIGIGLLLLLGHFFIISEAVLPLLGSNIFTEKLLNYIGTDRYGQQIGLSAGILFRILLLLLFIRMKAGISISPDWYTLLRNGFFIAIMFSLILNNVDILAHRMAYGYREFQIFIFAYLVTAFHGKSKLLVAWIILLYSLFLLFRLLNTPHLTEFYHYKTVFE